MREALLGKLVLLLSRATLEELAAIYRFVTGQSLPESQRGIARALPEPVMADVSSQPGIEYSPVYAFRRVGRRWEVVCGGGRPFRLRNTLWARYLMEKLSEGGPEEMAFAEHLRTQLSIGHECLYSQPQGRIWD